MQLINIAGSAIALLTCLTNATPAVVATRDSKIEARAPPAGYTYQGCFTNFAPITGTPALNTFIGSSLTMTLNKCAIACKNFEYYGAVNGISCYCGNSIRAGAIALPIVDTCAVPCAGNIFSGNPFNFQFCGGLGVGGIQQISIYRKNAGTVPPVPPAPVYSNVGCYRQAFGTGPLTDGDLNFPAGSGLTIQTCEALCVGFRFYGLRNGNRCTCGNTLEAGALIIDPSLCQVKCVGDSQQNCGGNQFTQVFATRAIAECTTVGSTRRVLNPGFEMGEAYWTKFTTTPNDIKWKATADKAFGGTKRSARFVSTSNSASMAIYQSVPVCPGVGYVLSIQSLEEPGSGCIARVVYNEVEEFIALGNSAAWTKSQSFLVSFNERAELRIFVTCDGGRPMKIFYVDDVELRPATPADSALFPGDEP